MEFWVKLQLYGRIFIDIGLWLVLSVAMPPDEMGTYMEEVITSRRSCRRFLDKNVEPELITRILSAMAAAPTGGNAQSVEYTVIDDKDRVHEIWQIAYEKMDSDAKKHIYTHSFSDFYYSKMKQSEKTVRKDDLLLCNAHGLGTAIMSYPAEVLNELAPQAREMLGIPQDHYTKLMVGFGYPEIPYARGVQKDRSSKVHRYSQNKNSSKK